MSKELIIYKASSFKDNFFYKPQQSFTSLTKTYYFF